MKTFIKVFLFAILALSLSGTMGCSKKKDRKTTIGRGDGGRTDLTGGTSQPPGSSGPFNANVYSGFIGRAGSPQATFQNRVDGFFSAFGDPNKLLGTVSGQPNQATGVVFNGFAKTQSGNFNPGASNDGAIAAGARFNIAILDDISNEIDPTTGQKKGGWLFNQFQLVSGNITGQTVNMQFKDGLGTITINGTYNNVSFTGTISFQNDKYWNSQPGEAGFSGVLGSFYIDTCKYFVCN